MLGFFDWLFKSREQIDQDLLDTGWYFRAKDGRVRPKVKLTNGSLVRTDPEWLEICIREQVDKMNKMSEEDWGILEGYRP